MTLAEWLGGERLLESFRWLLDRGITPVQAAELTPHQLYAMIYEPARPPESSGGDPMDQLYRTNQARGAKGLPPVFPQLVKFSTERVKL